MGYVTFSAENFGDPELTQQTNQHERAMTLSFDDTELRTYAWLADELNRATEMSKMHQTCEERDKSDKSSNPRREEKPTAQGIGGKEKPTGGKKGDEGQEKDPRGGQKGSKKGTDYQEKKTKGKGGPRGGGSGRARSPPTNGHQPPPKRERDRKPMSETHRFWLHNSIRRREHCGFSRDSFSSKKKKHKTLANRLAPRSPSPAGKVGSKGRE